MKIIVAAVVLMASFCAEANPVCNQISDLVLRASIDRDNGVSQEKVRQSMMLNVDASLWTIYSSFINTVYSEPKIPPADFAMGAMQWCEHETQKVPGKRT